MYFPIIDVLKENFIAKIPSIVTQWLTDNVDPVGSAVVVDTSLSISGAAADAKITGDELNDLKSDFNYDINEIRTNGTLNIFNDDIIKTFDGISFSNGVFSGEARKFSGGGLIIQDSFEENSKYYISFYGKNTGASTSGNGLGIRINYTNGTYGVTYLPNSTTDFTRYVVLSESGRTVSSIKFYYNSGGDNVWEIKDIQIEKAVGTNPQVSDYVPYYTANDRLARSAINEVSTGLSVFDNVVLKSGLKSIDSFTDYQSFDDLPVNKIMHIVGNVKLDNAPPGYVDIGHNNMDSGSYGALVLTYSAKTQTSPVVQICVLYNNSYTYDKLPRTATRFGRYTNGSIAWTDWSTMSENTCLHASDKVVDVNSYQTVTFGDFNDAQPNAIYQVDFNCGTTILNNPSPGHSGVLLTYSFSPIQKHALVQNHYALEGDNLYLYIRYCYKQAQDDIRWTPWQKIAVNIDENAIIFNKGELEANTDINTVSGNTVYFLKTSGNYTNSPFVNSAGFLTTYVCDNLLYQRAEGLGGSRYTRYSLDEGSTWSAWA